MSFFRRMLSSDFRAAQAAEAAGDFELAAERYALAGEFSDAVRVHLARAERAERRGDEINALRDALYWTDKTGNPNTSVSRALGRALLAKARAEGIATERDKHRVREAAEYLVAAGEYAAGGEALESVGDDAAAAEAYRRGGLVDRLEGTLGRQQRLTDGRRAVEEHFADYRTQFSTGDRDAALEALAKALSRADDKDEYRRLHDDLQARVIHSGRVTLAVRGGASITLCSGPTVTLGRDTLCDFTLRSPGVSRQHAEIRVGEESFELIDRGSRHGTRIGGIHIDHAMTLSGSGEFDLGDTCTMRFQQDGPVLWLTVAAGKSAHRLGCAARDTSIPLDEIGAILVFREGRPLLSSAHGPMTVGHDRIAIGSVQLIRGDHVAIGATEIDVIQ